MSEARRRIEKALEASSDEVDMSRLDLETVPDELQGKPFVVIRLSSNRLTRLPTWIGDLTGLVNLTLWDNQLTQLPDSIGHLAELTWLNLSNNRLTHLPDTIGNLTKLTDLKLSNNRLTHLPDTIGNLTKLTRLGLWSNQLSDLPNTLPTSIQVIDVTGNPLPPEMAAASAAGTDELLSFLRLQATEERLIRQVKLILVGEGAAGKSSLLAALRGEPWVPNRLATHGIEVKAFELPHDDGPITFNAWDFGGQDIYRPTHQLFFTAPAIYLVLWHPRFGANQSNVEHWINLIKDRVGRNARIHVVASHGGPKEPASRLDTAALLDAFGDMIVGIHEVDSETHQGLDELRYSLRDTAVDIPHMQRRLPASWLDLQATLSASDEPYLEYPQYLSRAEEHGLTERSAHSLARNATAIGRWCFYPDQDGLDNLVVLKGDWLSTAMSHVLNDRQTIVANGLVTHRRLRELWSNPPVGTGYDRRLHRVFLQLMEKYQLSYRVNTGSGEPTSLVAQLVRSDQPDLSSWHNYGRTLAEHTYICQIVDTEQDVPLTRIPEGLIFQLIVQFHKFSLGRYHYAESLHWTRGMVLDSPRNGRALLQVRGGAIHITVKNEHPRYLLQRFAFDIADVVADSWNGLRVVLQVPCPSTRCGEACSGAFDYDTLRAWQQEGRPEAPCSRCSQWRSIASLLTHQPETVPTTSAQLDRLNARIGAVHNTLSSVDRSMARVSIQQEENLYLLLRAFDDQAAHGPRLFTVDPVDRAFRNPQIGSTRVRLRLWCEHSRLPLHLLHADQPDAGVYDIDVPRGWLVRAAPWIRGATAFLKSYLPVATSGLQIDKALWSDVGAQLTLSEKFLSAICEDARRATDAYVDDRAPERSDGEPTSAQLRLLHSFLREKDPTFAGLEKVRDAHHTILWVDPQFRGKYVLPAPRMPGD